MKCSNDYCCTEVIPGWEFCVSCTLEMRKLKDKILDKKKNYISEDDYLEELGELNDKP